MKPNSIQSIKNDGGEWLLLVDYGTEGISCVAQYDDPKDAFIASLSNTWGGPTAIVQLRDFILSTVTE